MWLFYVTNHFSKFGFAKQFFKACAIVIKQDALTDGHYLHLFLLYIIDYWSLINV